MGRASWVTVLVALLLAAGSSITPAVQADGHEHPFCPATHPSEEEWRLVETGGTSTDTRTLRCEYEVGAPFDHEDVEFVGSRDVGGEPFGRPGHWACDEVLAARDGFLSIPGIKAGISYRGDPEVSNTKIVALGEQILEAYAEDAVPCEDVLCPEFLERSDGEAWRRSWPDPPVASSAGHMVWSCFYDTEDPAQPSDKVEIDVRFAQTPEHGLEELCDGETPPHGEVYMEDHRAAASIGIDGYAADEQATEVPVLLEDAQNHTVRMFELIRDRILPCPGAGEDDGGTDEGGDASEGDEQADEEEITNERISFDGVAATLDKDGEILPIENAKGVVALHNPDGEDIFDFQTGAAGEFEFDAFAQSDATAYSIGVWLDHADGWLEVYDRWTFGDEPVQLAKVNRPLAEDWPDSTVLLGLLAFEPFSIPATNLDEAVIEPNGDVRELAFDRKRLQDAANRYWAVQNAGAFAMDSLSVELDHELPVTFEMHEPLHSRAFYRKASSEIHFGNLTPASLLRFTTIGRSDYDYYRTPHTSYHEFGHHLNADAAMGGEDTFPDQAPADENHDGVKNTDSQDSFVEGFANFYAGLVEDDGYYPMLSGPERLEWNLHWNDQAETVPWEEFNVAALLWDLVDDTSEIGDRFNLTPKELFEAINHGSVSNVRTLYLALTEAYGDLDTDDEDPLTDLDRLFVLHRFFSDTDDDGNWSPGEPIGWADYWGDQARNAAQRQGQPGEAGLRPEVPEAPFALLPIDATSPDGSQPSIRQVHVDIVFNLAHPADRFMIDVPEGATMIPIRVPGGADAVILEPISPGYDASVYLLTSDTFWDAVAAAEPESPASLPAHTFELEPNDLEPPSLTAIAEMEDTVQVSWDVPSKADHVIVVRRVDRAPAHPSDGTVVHEGAAGSATDARTFAGLPVHYAAFSVSQDGSISPPATASVAALDNSEPAAPQGGSQAPGDDGEEDGGSPWPWIVGGLAVAALGAFLVLRRRPPGNQPYHGGPRQGPQTGPPPGWERVDDPPGPPR